MSQSKSRRFSVGEVKEELLRLLRIAEWDSFLDPDEKLGDLPNLSILDPRGIPVSQLGVPVYSGPTLASKLLAGVSEQDKIGNQFKQITGLLQADKALGRSVSKLLDEELSRIPEYKDRTQGTEAQILIFKLRAVLVARHKTVQEARKKPSKIHRGPYDSDFTLRIMNFDTHEDDFKRPVKLYFNFDLRYEDFMVNLQNWTSPRIIPPPLPKLFEKPWLPKDSGLPWAPTYSGAEVALKVPVDGVEIEEVECVEREFSDAIKAELSDARACQYSTGVLSRPAGKKGYDLEDGPWKYQVRGCKRAGDLSSAEVIKPWGVITKMADFSALVKFLVETTRLLYYDELVVEAIHSQDEIAIKKWKCVKIYDDADRYNDDERNQWFEEWDITPARIRSKNLPSVTLASPYNDPDWYEGKRYTWAEPSF